MHTGEGKGVQGKDVVGWGGYQKVHWCGTLGLSPIQWPRLTSPKDLWLSELIEKVLGFRKVEARGEKVGQRSCGGV